MIPLSVPNFEGNEEKYTHDAVSQGWVSTGGAFVSGFEKEIAEYTGANASAACQSGTAALHLSLIECGVKQGDLVIVPTLTFIAAVNPVRYTGADPVFMDCDDSLCMDPVKLRKFCENECRKTSGGLVHIATGRKVRAVIVVHVFGNWADMEAIMSVAEEYGLLVIEDATEALGTFCNYGKYKGTAAGTAGNFGAYSFNGNKIITTGGGGMVVGRDKKAVEHIKFISTQAKTDEHFYIHDEIGYNYRMTNVQAALGVAQMEELEEFIKRKNDNYEIYRQLLEGCKCGTLLPFRENVRSNKWFYSFVLDRSVCNDSIRSYIEKMQSKGVQTRPIWGLIHEQRPYAGSIAFEIELASYYADRVINLPCSTNITHDQIEEVCKTICGLQENNS